MEEKKTKIRTTKRTGRLKAARKMAAFFSKLPKIGDGNASQNKLRSEWK